MFSSSIKGAKGSGDNTINPNFRDVAFLSHFDGSNLDNTTSPGFTDQSTPASSASVSTPLQAFPVTSSNPFNSNYSVYCQTSQQPRFSIANNAAFAMGTGSFTIEAWIYPYTYSGSPRSILNIDDANSAGRLGVWFGHPAYPRQLVLFGSSGLVIYNSLTEIQLNTWTHFAFVRNGSTIVAYINGVAASNPTTVTTNFTCTTGTVWVCATDNTGGNISWDGLMSNLRITKGVAVYTGNFTVPTGILGATQSAGTNISAITGAQCSLLTFIKPRTVDLSTFNHTIYRGGALANDSAVPQFVPETPFARSTIGAPSTAAPWSLSSFGTSIGPVSVNYTSAQGVQGSATYKILTDAKFGFGTGNYTIEFFLYAQASTTRSDWTLVWTSSGQSLMIYFDGGTPQNLIVVINGSIQITGPLATAVTGQWVHVALSRTSTTDTRLYINGVQSGTTVATNYNLGATNQLLIGNESSTIGSMASYRILKGTGLYTGTFTPPTSPLTPITNTVLCLTGQIGIIDQTQKTTLSGSNLGPYLSTTRSKFGATSLLCDGTTTAYLTSYYFNNNFNSNIFFGTGSFTIELWFWAASGVSDKGMVQISATAGGFGGQTGVAIGYGTSNNIRIFYGATSAQNGTASTVSTQTWTHVALVRTVTWSGSTPTGQIKVYINGVADTALTVTDSYSYPISYLTLGGYESSAKTWNGNIDEMRISRTNVYTANFAAPNSPFPDQ